MTPYQVLTVASIVEKEGYIPVNMPDTARVIYNRLAQGTPLQMDSTVLYALGQDGGPVTVAGPQDPVALQHVPQHRPDADTDLHAVETRSRRPSIRRPVPGCTSCWSRRTAPWPSPTPTPSSWPTSSWPRAVASPERRRGAGR